MKVKDNGSNNFFLKEKLNGNISPQEIEAQLELLNKNIINNDNILDNTKENSKKLKSNQEKQCNGKNDFDELRLNKCKINSKNRINNNNFIKNDFNNLKNNNCINNIDFINNTIIISKQNLKELNNINKDIRNDKKNEFSSKKGEIINLFVNEKINYNRDINNSIKNIFGYFADNNFYSSLEGFGQIKSNCLFPNDLIEKFLEKKRNNSKEKNENNCLSSFGNNPLQALKDIQKNLIQYTSQKNNKLSIKQFKINQKNIKEQNIHLQNYIKTLPVLNCPESKIFKTNQYYIFNKINDDKNMNNINKNNKNIKTNNFFNKEKEENEEEETIDRHKKKKFINKKRNIITDKK